MIRHSTSAAIFSRCLLGLALLAAKLTGGEPTHWADDGVAVIELERLLPAKGWEMLTTQEGFTGAGYIADLGGGGDLTVRVILPLTGRWRIALRNRHDHPDHTLENDCRLSVNGSTPTKTFSSQGGAWNWKTKLEPAKGGFAEPVFELSAGLHEIVVSGRSAGFCIDRMHIALEGATGAEDIAKPETTFIPVPPAQAAKAVLSAWARGELGKALSAASRDPASAALVSELEGLAGRRRDQLARAKTDEPEIAAVLLSVWAQRWRGCDLGKSLAEQAAAWAKEPAAQEAKAARLALEGMLPTVSKLRARLEAGGKVPETDLAAVVKALLSLAEHHPTTSAGRQATTLAEQLKNGG